MSESILQILRGVAMVGGGGFARGEVVGGGGRWPGGGSRGMLSMRRKYCRRGNSECDEEAIRVTLESFSYSTN